MDKTFTSDKERIPKASSYSLRSSSLSKAMSDSDLPFSIHLIQGPFAFFLDAYFWPPNPNIDCERLYVRVGAVPSREAHWAREFLESIAIPELVAWAQQIASLPINSPVRRETQHFSRGLPEPPPQL
jgi:hypothetical protein